MQPDPRPLPTPSAQPTLLVFTQGAAADRARHPLLPGRHAGAEVELRRGLLAAALEAGREAGCALEVSSPRGTLPGTAFRDTTFRDTDSDADSAVRHATQTGTGFGERLERACHRAGQRGQGPLLVVGTDVPGLEGRHLRAALDALAADPEAVVLGPSPDGGFYLLASRQPVPGLAGLTRWCRSDTLVRLRRSLAAAGRRVVLLEALADLDRPADLERWLARAPATSSARRPAGSTTSAPAPTLSAALWLRSLWRHLASLLASLKRPLSTPLSREPRLAPVPVRPSRAPPRRR